MTPADLMKRLESYYGFECEGGPLRNCVEWHQLKAHVSTLQSAPPAGAQGETRCVPEQFRNASYDGRNGPKAWLDGYDTARTQQAEEIARLRADYDKVLTAWAESRARHLAAESQVHALQAQLSEAQQRIETLTKLAREVLVWLPDNLPSSELYAAVDNLAAVIPAAPQEDQP